MRLHELVNLLVGRMRERYARVEGLGRLTGLPDLVDGEAVYEVKFQRALPNQLPKPHHMLQARVYAWMAGKRVARLWYVSPDGLVEYELHPLTEDELKRHLKRWRHSTPLWPEWECRYCPWRELCERGRG